MNDQIRAFLERLDRELIPLAKEGERFDMFHLGRSSLVMHYAFQLSTNDVDFVRLRTSELERMAVDLLGKGTEIALTLGLYLDPVDSALPPLPAGFRAHATAVPGNWKVLRLWKLEIHDLAATKLKSFRPQDREDLQMMCDRGLLTAAQLRAALEDAFPWRSPKEGDKDEDPDNPDWSKACRSFKRVEAYLKGEISSI